jgi:2-methylcitrate dehydratase PrpD
MRHDSGRVSIAMGHAASQAGGTFAALGTSGVKVHQARGGLSGLLSAELAAAGVDASKQALTTERGGLLASYAGGGLPERLTDGLGTNWRLMDISLRRWPAASSLQPVIEATFKLRDRAQDIEEVQVELPPRAYLLNGTPGWDTSLAALQSARWNVAVALADGDLWLKQTSDERRVDEQVDSFARYRVRVSEDESLPATGARVTTVTPAGYEHTELIELPLGDPRRPLSRDDIVAKLDRAARGIGLGDRVDGIVEAVEALESAESVDRLTSLLEVR